MKPKKVAAPASEWMSPREAAADVPCHVSAIFRNAGKNGMPELRKVCGQWKLRRSEWKAYIKQPPVVRGVA